MTQSGDGGAVLQVDGLTIVATTGKPIVRDISFELGSGHLLGVVGESGSGKTTVALACLGYLRSGMRVASGSMSVGGAKVAAPGAGASSGRGDAVSYVPQSAGFALNPSLRLRTQISTRRAGQSDAPTQQQVLAAFGQVGLPSDPEFLNRYPHQLSGGQQQRVLIAVALLTDPSLVVLDEPTTGLDVTTQTQILSLVRELCNGRRVAGLFVSHDISAVAQLCDRIAVMYEGRVVESGPTREVLSNPSHPYTAGLIAAVPDISGRRPISGMPRSRSGASAPGCPFAPRCGYADEPCWTTDPAASLAGAGAVVRCHFPLNVPRGIPPAAHRTGCTAISQHQAPGARTPPPAAPLLDVVDLTAHYGQRRVLDKVNLQVFEGSCTALVGESGSGKSTLSRSIIGLHHNWSGEVRYGGRSMAHSAAKRDEADRAGLQYIFQNPYDALNPRRTVAGALIQPLQARGVERSMRQARIGELLEMVELSAGVATRYPHELSGGELQRVAIARALASEPRMLLCDEVTSALDVSVQAAIAKLLARLQAEMGLTLLFVTHNLGLVRQIADFVVVLKDGLVCEAAQTEQLFSQPTSEYTTRLLSDVPDLWRSIENWRLQESVG